ncbi:DUF4062 domain-containing protein [Nocardioides piscis]|uniref:DUF4062 domain-containing protein n=1 Tax=Nocardioides piscis TaxID=2714938 RepID=A0A6G7YED2_9ACTN|nr:DUF4062 domain-containing protein [Nocardioides piscis]QIK74998.1 DUF4062 domain-containing protein [Nocardioides piscis]
MDADKRYQVFVSSTYLDLMEARAAVVSALLNLDAIPAGMELFPAADDDAWTLIEDVIADSDYYLLIIGGKYGSVDPDLEISFTEREYDTAVRLKKPVMAFLHGQPGKLLAERTEDSDARREALAAFRRKVETAKHVKYWTSPEDLAGKVALTWNTFRRRYPATGWIKADQATNKESLTALAKAQKEIEELRAQLESVRTQAPPGTDRLAQREGKFSLPLYAKGKWSDISGYPRYSVGVWTSVEMTWDRAFGYLGLRMMQEADEPTLKTDLCSVAEFDNSDDVRKALQAEIEGEVGKSGDTRFKWWWEGLEVSDEDFQTLLLQFNALGLIQHSKRNRSVKDTANYWSLTPYGHTRLVQLRALQAGEESLLRADYPASLEEESEAEVPAAEQD